MSVEREAIAAMSWMGRSTSIIGGPSRAMLVVISEIESGSRCQLQRRVRSTLSCLRKRGVVLSEGLACCLRANHIVRQTYFPENVLVRGGVPLLTMQIWLMDRVTFMKPSSPVLQLLNGQPLVSRPQDIALGVSIPITPLLGVIQVVRLCPTISSRVVKARPLLRH